MKINKLLKGAFLLLLGISLNTITAWCQTKQVSKNAVKKVTIEKKAGIQPAIKSIELGPNETVLLTENFEGLTFPPAGWFQEIIYQTPGGDYTEWSGVETGSYPFCQPVQGNKMASINSLFAAFGKTRLSSYALDLSGYDYSYLTFHMYHNDSTECDDNIMVQVSTDSINWTNFSAEISGYDAIIGNTWFEHAIDLSSAAGNSEVYVAFLAQSKYECSNMYIDSVKVIGADELEAVPSVITGSYSELFGESVKISGTVNANFLATTATIQCDVNSDFSTPIASAPVQINGFLPTDISSTISGLEPSTFYYYRVRAQNSMGTSYGDTLTFTTYPVNGPLIYDFAADGNDGFDIHFTGEVDGMNGHTSVILQYGLDKNITNQVNCIPPVINTDEQVEAIIHNPGLSTKYYFRIKAENSADTIYSDLDSLITASNDIYDTLDIDDNAFLKGRYVNVGVNYNGALVLTILPHSICTQEPMTELPQLTLDLQPIMVKMVGLPEIQDILVIIFIRVILKKAGDCNCRESIITIITIALCLIFPVLLLKPRIRLVI